MNWKPICFLALLVSLALLFPSGLLADTFGIDFSNTTGAESLGNPPFTLGWGFSLSAPVVVTALAFYDDGENGLGESHNIGLWDGSGNLLASGSVQAGNLSPLIGQWREVAVTPTGLQPGFYSIGALFLSGDDPVWFPNQMLDGFVTGPNLTYNGAAFSVGSSLTDPTFPDGAPGFFGANLVITPEPSSIFLVGSGLLSLTGTLSRRKLTSRKRKV